MQVWTGEQLYNFILRCLSIQLKEKNYINIGEERIAKASQGKKCSLKGALPMFMKHVSK